MAVAFIIADQLGLQRDLYYYALDAATVVGLFVARARDTSVAERVGLPHAARVRRAA
jgi:hypothetical protein